MSKERKTTPSLKSREFKLNPVSESVRIPMELMAFAREKGYSIYKPGLQRDRESLEERTQDENGTIHITTRTTIGPSYLEEYDEFPKIPVKWREYGGEFLLQSENRAYILTLGRQNLGSSHPYDADILLHFVSIANVPLLNSGAEKDREEKWWLEVDKRRPRPSYKHFESVRIENDVEGMLIEIYEGHSSFVTINSEDELLQEFLGVLSGIYGVDVVSRG